jgi:hypothetical protein
MKGLSRVEKGMAGGGMKPAKRANRTNEKKFWNFSGPCEKKGL